MLSMHGLAASEVQYAQHALQIAACQAHLGSASSAMNIVGTPSRLVHASAATASSVAAGLKDSAG